MKLTIESVKNGWIVKDEFDDGCSTYVFSDKHAHQSFAELLDLIKREIGPEDLNAPPKSPHAQRVIGPFYSRAPSY